MVNFPNRPAQRRNKPAPFLRRAGGVFDRLQQEVNELFGRFQRLWDDDGMEMGHNQWGRLPAADFDDDEDAYWISVELPGMKPEDAVDGADTRPVNDVQ